MVHLLLDIRELFAFVAFLLVTLPASALGIIEVLEGPGEYPSRDSSCIAEVRISSMGGYRVLTLRDGGRQIGKAVDDMTALAWLPDGRLIYSTSPIYGKPGIYAFNCTSKEVSHIVRPRTKIKGYPDGADYFALHSVKMEKGFIVEYYYAANIDTAPPDVRQASLLRKITLNEKTLRAGGK